MNRKFGRLSKIGFILFWLILMFVAFSFKRKHNSFSFDSFNNITGSPYKIIPNTVHYVMFGTTSLNFITFLSLVSVIKVQQSNIWIHCDCRELSGFYWSLVESLSNTAKVPIKVSFLRRPTHVYGQLLSSVYHSSDIARIQVLMESGGIYLDTDMVILKPLDEFLHFEMVVGWPEKEYFGNQNMAQEHGLGPDGFLVSEDTVQTEDNTNSFFHQCESGKYTPRCIMLDLEPRVIQTIKNCEYNQLFDRQNMFVGEDGGGAGNNWASGYVRANKHCDDLLELIKRETEAMDLMEGSLISHAISGGTGAGMGSYILELLTDYFPKKTVQTYSVFPTSVNLGAKRLEEDGQCGDVVIEPYNSLLTLLRLTSYADSVVVLDNLALHRLTSANMFTPHPSFANINKIVADVMTASLAPVRYPKTMFNSLSDIVLSLTPVPNLHFLMAGYAPLRSFDDQEGKVKGIMKTSVESVLNRLSKMRNMMVSLHHPPNSPHGYISVFNIIQSVKESKDMRTVASQLRKKLRYLPWTQPVYQTVLSSWSPYLSRPNHTSGLTVVNHSAIVDICMSTLSQFKKLYSRMAYMDQMQNLSGFGELQQELEECKHSCENLIQEYNQALTPGYLSSPVDCNQPADNNE